MNQHQFQFNDDGPDWCKWCGTFSRFCIDYNGNPSPCTADQTLPPRYDSEVQENRERLVEDIFGKEKNL